MEQQQRIEQGLSIIDLIFQHVTASSILACLLIGWGAMLTARFPLHATIKDDRWATWWTRLVCIVGGMLGTALTWPVRDWRALLAWSLAFGAICPVAWFILTALVDMFAPKLAEKLKMKRLTLEESDNVRPAEPSPGPP